MIDLEKWIEEKSFGAAVYGQWFNVVAVGDLRALFAGKVLCDAEPTAWISPANGYLFPTRVEAASYADDEEPEMPLYAAASFQTGSLSPNGEALPVGDPAAYGG